MKKSTEVTKTSNFSWQLNAVASIFYEASSDEAKIISLALFKRLAMDALLHVSRFLPLRRNREKQATLTNRALMFAVSYDKAVDPAFNRLLHEDYLLEQFRYLIAIEGEDNQNQAEAILNQLLAEENYVLMSKLISNQGSITDAAGRCFKSMSAFGYTFWAGDTRLSRMLEKYIHILEEKDDETKQTVFKECKHVEEQGIEFTCNGERVENSKHFDWQPLIEAYHAYIAAAMLLINANNGRGEWSKAAWAPVDILWLNIGKELAKVPTHVAQEYCSDIPFYPLSNFRAALNRQTLKRTVKFYNCRSDKADKMESWFLRGVANLNLGGLFSIYKAGCEVGARPWGRALGVSAMAAADLAAITALCEMRTVNDRKQTLENLKPLAPGADFRP